MAGLRRLLAFATMVLVTLVVAHNLVFLLAFGDRSDEALASSGHDATWGTAVAIVIATGLALAGLSIWRLHRLGLVARELAPHEGPLAAGPGGFGGRLLHLWWRLAAAASVLFVLQENLEHAHAGEALPGVSVLGSSGYPNATIVLVLIALAVAIVATLIRCRRDLLLAAIANALGRGRRRPDHVVRRPVAWVDRRQDSLVGRRLAPRAPPPPALAGGSTPVIATA